MEEMFFEPHWATTPGKERAAPRLKFKINLIVTQIEGAYAALALRKIEQPTSLAIRRND